MTEFQYLTKGNNLLLQITRQRRWLISHKLSKLPFDFATQELNNIEYAKSIIRTGSAMKVYLANKKNIYSPMPRRFGLKSGRGAISLSSHIKLSKNKME